MARDEFFRDIRRAVSFMAPRVETDSPFTNPDYIQKMLRGTDVWLSKGVVEAYRPEDYPDMEERDRERLTRSVEEFLGIAQSVNPRAPVPREQRDAAIPLFMEIVRVVQALVLKDWLQASAALLGEAERWAREVEWPTRRFPKEFTEDFLGGYKLDKLVFAAEGAQLVLAPVGRYAPGTDGLFDLAVMPAYDSVMVVRHGGRWFIHPLAGEEQRQDWSKEAFLHTSLELARLP